MIKKSLFINLLILLCILIIIPEVALSAPTLTPPPGGAGNPTPLPNGMVGVSYSTQITASGCDKQYYWSVTGLPPGLTYSKEGTNNNTLTISGTPTTAGSYMIWVRVSALGCGSRSGYYRIVITPAPALTIVTTSLPDGVTGIPYSATITAQNGVQPYSWFVASGQLPPGLTLSPTGTPSTTLSGTPTTAGAYTFTVRVKDSGNNWDDQQFTVNISSNLAITTTSPLPSGNEGESYSTIIEGTGGSGAYTWSVSDGLPPGLTLAGTGTPSTTLSGTPTAFGTFTFTITLTDAFGNTAVKDFTLYIAPSSLDIVTTQLNPNTVAICTPYTADITATGGTPPYTWGVVAGMLPPGLAINPSGTPSTTISGIPTQNGNYGFTVRVTDSKNVSRTKNFTINVTGSATSCEPNILDYTAYPPFVQLSGVKPNVLIVLDNSGSMYEFAYKIAGKGGSASNPDDSYDPNNTYYGYFDPVRYSYNSAQGYFYKDANGTWDGNFLNWLTMRRVDILRKVLVGGKAIPRSQTQINYLIATERPDRDFWKRSGNKLYRIYNAGGPYESICINNQCDSNSLYNVRIQFKDTPGEPTGLLHENINRMRFGLMFFNLGSRYEQGGGGKDGGYLALDMGTTATSLVTQIENTDPGTWTPLGETMYEALRFYQATWSAYNGGTYQGKDPMQEYCQKNFVLILTDGESTMDRNIPGGNWGSTVADPNFNVCSYMNRIATNEGYPSQCATDANTMKGTYYLEGVTYYAHINDIRSDLNGTQNITTYTVFAFDESPVGKELLKKASKYGGFNDYDNDGKPYTDSTCGTANPNAGCNEWDANRDGVPDTYFEAQEGSALADKIKQALEDILKRVSSGTSASVLATRREGEGAIFQAYFKPSVIEGATEIKWVGNMHGLFLDKWGNMREDSYDPNTATSGDRRLCYGANDPVSECSEPDTIVEIYYDETDQKTKANRYPGVVDENGKPIGTPTPIAFEDLQTISEVGKNLWTKTSDSRIIKTTIDGSNAIDFSVSNKASLRPYLRAGTNDEAEAIIRFIRGEDDPVVNGITYDYRPRTMTIGNASNVWKLGDIVYSSPIATSKPAEDYHLLYKDGTYGDFHRKYANRRMVIYAGANDGMLHAFNGGFYDKDTYKFWLDYDEGSGYNDSPEGGEPQALGEEIWAFIPQSLLPHLKWLTMNDYTHVYYVDLMPKIVDARIFTEEGACSSDIMDSACIHPGGWGTVLIGGMRYGGRDISYMDISWSSQRTFRSQYFALDITDPLNPRLLWTFPSTTDSNPNGLPDLGLTTVHPAVLRVGVTGTNPAGDWYVIIGSGPDAGVDSYKGISERKPEIYVVDLKTGTVKQTFSSANGYSILNINNAFMADPSTIDVNLADNVVDAIYMGSVYCPNANPICSSSQWRGRMFRITTNKGDSDPANWRLNIFYDPQEPITTSPSIAMDDWANLWIYFGTGRYYSIEDTYLDGTERWAFYGIKDYCQSWIDPTQPSCSTPVMQTELLNASGIAVMTDESVTGAPSGISNFTQLQTQIDEGLYKGWYVRFPNAGERNLNKAGVLGGVVVWTTYVPQTGDICSLAGLSRLYATFYKTGTAYPEPIIGTTGTGEVKTSIRDIDLEKGVPTSPSFAITGEQSTTAYVVSGQGAVAKIPIITAYKIKSLLKTWSSRCQ